MLEYRIVKAADGKPLVLLESPLGNGQEIRPDVLRKLAAELIRIADLADEQEMGRAYRPLHGNTEY